MLSLGLLDYIPVVLDVVCGHGGVGDPVIDDGVHAHRHRVPRQNLEGVEGVHVDWSKRSDGEGKNEEQDEGT